MSDSVIGAWVAVSFDAKIGDVFVPIWCGGASGILEYFADGGLTANLFANQVGVETGDLIAAVRHISYVGQWSISGRILNHQISHGFPYDLPGKLLAREFAVDGDQLTLLDKGASFGDANAWMRAVWKRRKT